MNFLKIMGLEPKRGARGDYEWGSLHGRLEGCLADLPESEVKLIAGFAGLLWRVAYSDLKFEASERDKIREILQRRTTLDADRVDRIMTLVDQDADRYFGSENVYYTRLVNAVAAEPLKLEILDTLFAVAAANGSICTREEAELRIIATGLFLSHDDYIRIRLRYREFLDVLK